MTLTAPRISVGFEPIYNKTLNAIPNPVAYELTPAVTFAKGDMVTITAGKLALATSATVANVVGVMAESIAAAGNPSGSITYGKVYDHPDNVYRVTFVDHIDSTATGGTTTTLLDTALAASSNDVWNGALLYIYEGPSAGSIRTIKDYTGSSDTLTVDEAFPEAPTAASKYILLGAASEANDVINVGLGGLVLKDEDSVDANAGRLSSGAKVGPLVCVDIRPADLMMDVMIRKSCHIFG
jgi:hypothetical protein